jgi:hypothetical protein
VLVKEELNCSPVRTKILEKKQVSFNLKKTKSQKLTDIKTKRPLSQKGKPIHSGIKAVKYRDL